MSITAAFTRSLDGQRVQCFLCPHRCALQPGETGRCLVRFNRDGRLIAGSYGRPAALLPEAIEKKPLFHFFPGSLVLSLGTHGCNLSCSGCINWRISQNSGESQLPEMTPPAVVAQAQAQRADGIAFTFTEPAVFYEYCRDIALHARQAGLFVVAKSNGFMLPGVLKSMSEWLDAVNMDLKGWYGSRYRAMMGGALGPTLHSLRLARRLGLWLEISTLIIPGFNDTPVAISNMARFITDELGPQSPWHLLRFFPEHQMAAVPPTSQFQLARAVEIGQRAGLQYIYTQTLAHGQWLQTRCPMCQKTVIEREPHHLRASKLVQGCCPTCSTPIPGIWQTNFIGVNDE